MGGQIRSASAPNGPRTRPAPSAGPGVGHRASSRSFAATGSGLVGAASTAPARPAASSPHLLRPRPPGEGRRRAALPPPSSRSVRTFGGRLRRRRSKGLTAAPGMEGRQRQRAGRRSARPASKESSRPVVTALGARRRLRRRECGGGGELGERGNQSSRPAPTAWGARWGQARGARRIGVGGAACRPGAGRGTFASCRLRGSPAFCSACPELLVRTRTLLVGGATPP